MSTPSNPDSVLVRYGEIGLKTPGIRRHLEGLLSNHLGVMLTRQAASYSMIIRERGRFFIQTTDAEVVAHAASRVFGVVSTSPVWTVSSNPDKIINQVKELTPSFISEGQSFAVRVRRVKTHPFTSQEIASQVGAAIIEVTGKNQPAAPVDLNNPDVEIHIEIREKSSYIFNTIIEGPGGLPYGSQGTVLGLHSGGIDSPVAQWLMMKRGARVIPLYFDSDVPPQQSLRTRALQSAKILAEWIPHNKVELLIMPYYEILRQLSKSKHPKITCILCKRMMYRMGAIVAAQEGAKALVTGETLGQVASQTLDNLAVLDSVVALPIFRPLIGIDKSQTMDLARRIGSYDVSSQDVGDCFAVPKQPSIAALLDQIHEAEAALNIPEMVINAISELERVPVAK
ncbi:tRNA 4-thiouridine(8) synthase ThiI [Candidatus Bathyarchaeota archaeon]|nr:tRNA 4-thiouridine(8) synthase ThiI [Candidatus Bathyarchaeota archaeon]